ncbi:SDR family NAD(P)-dependent oxidoreductase [Actinoplanes sp. NPDC048988]|uniref:SDR family NAD(P)-dependent oxidoreductase n=1 Tax=Actinoplanes sp. NPDC048988 TaxID=3363901 RepID=UPI00371A8295
MTTRFDAHSTAAQVLSGVDLSGRTAIVTGGYSGIGREAALALADAGAYVIVPARRPEVARQALRDGRIDIRPMDLADLASVEKAAGEIVSDRPAVDIVIGSAAVMACPETRVGPGWEAQFAINHLGHYALVAHLWPALKAAEAARVVMVASGRSPEDRMRWDDIHFTREYDKWAAYGQSKLAAVLFAHRLDQWGVRAFSASPGWVLSPLQRHLARTEMIEAGWIDAEGRPAPGLFRSAAQGAATPVWAATSPGAEPFGGSYCRDCAATETYSTDGPEGERLWDLSADLTGLDPRQSTTR